ncbi:MAG: hypothetical protein ACE5LU_03615 [Anaerolineae bacterium]
MKPTTDLPGEVAYLRLSEAEGGGIVRSSGKVEREAMTAAIKGPPRLTLWW